MKRAKHGHKRAASRCSGCILLKEPLSDLRESKKLTDRGVCVCVGGLS